MTYQTSLEIELLGGLSCTMNKDVEVSLLFARVDLHRMLWRRDHLYGDKYSVFLHSALGSNSEVTNVRSSRYVDRLHSPPKLAQRSIKIDQPNSGIQGIEIVSTG